MRIDISQFEALVAVADLGTFSAAAEELRITQPALSRRIAGLEAATELRLFERVGRSVKLTDAGSALMPFARRTLGEIRNARATVDTFRGVDSGTLLIVGLPSLIVSDLPRIVGSFRARYPNVRLQINAAEDTDEIQTMISGARCDVAITDLNVSYPGLMKAPLGEHRFVAVFPSQADAPLSRGQFPTLLREHLEGRTLVTMPQRTLTRQLTDAIYANLDVEPTEIVTVTQREALVPFALSGAGVTFVPEGRAVEAVKRGGGIAYPAPPVVRDFGLVYRAEAAFPALAAFLDVARTVASDLAAESLLPEGLPGDEGDMDHAQPPIDTGETRDAESNNDE